MLIQSVDFLFSDIQPKSSRGSHTFNSNRPLVPNAFDCLFKNVYSFRDDFFFLLLLPRECHQRVTVQHAKFVDL